MKTQFTKICGAQPKQHLEGNSQQCQWFGLGMCNIPWDGGSLSFCSERKRTLVIVPPPPPITPPPIPC